MSRVDSGIYLEGTKYFPSKPKDLAEVNDGIYLSSSVKCIVGSLPPDHVNFETKTDPVWDADRRVDVRVLREWVACSQGVASRVRGSAKEGMCFGCGSDKLGTHSIKERIQDVVVVGDTFLPPIIGANGVCIPVIRVEIPTPGLVYKAILKYLGEERSVQKKIRQALRPDDILIVLGMTSHLRRVGLHAYLEDMRLLSDSLVGDLKMEGKIVRIGLLLVPFTYDDKGSRDALARDSTVLASVFSIAKETSSNKLPLFVDGFLEMVKDTNSIKKNFTGVGVFVPPSPSSLIGNEVPIRTNPSLSLKGSLGFTGPPAPHGTALPPHAEFKFLMAFILELVLYLGPSTDFSPPQVCDLGSGVAEAIPRNNSKETKDWIRELTDCGVEKRNTMTAFRNTGLVVCCGGSESVKLVRGLGEQFSILPAQGKWKPELIRIHNTDTIPPTQKIIQDFPDRSLGSGSVEMTEPIVILRYLGPELMGTHTARLPEVLGKSHRNSSTLYSAKSSTNNKRKFGRNGEPLQVPDSVRVHLKQPRLKEPKELVLVLTDLLKLVHELKDMMCEVIIVGPFPRHFTPCCSDAGHFGMYPHAEHIKTSFEMSSFMALMPELSNCWFIHPGDVLGWGMPTEEKCVVADGVHLPEDMNKKVTRLVAAVVRDIRLNPGATPKRAGVDILRSNLYPLFVNEARARGNSFEQPMATKTKSAADPVLSGN
jgi:hypothetical protein